MAFSNPQNSVTFPSGAVTGQSRMVVGADTPPELQLYGIDQAILAYVTDVVTGVERGYFFIGSSNRMDGFGDSRAMVYGNVTYPTPGVPSSATMSDVHTNFQQDMFAQYPDTIFKDQRVRFWTDVSFEPNNSTNGVWSKVEYDGKEMPRGFVDYGEITAGSVVTSTAPTEAVVPSASWAREPTVTFKREHIYKLTLQAGYGIASAAASAMEFRIRKGAAAVAGQQLGLRTWCETSNLTFLNAPPWEFYIKNVTGADIATKLSATIRVAAGPNAALYGNGTSVPFNWVLQTLGPESGHPLSGMAVAIV